MKMRITAKRNGKVLQDVEFEPATEGEIEFQFRAQFKRLRGSDSTLSMFDVQWEIAKA